MTHSECECINKNTATVLLLFELYLRYKSLMYPNCRG